MDPFGLMWTKSDLFGHIETHFDSVVPIWTHLDQFWPIWSHLDPWDPFEAIWTSFSFRVKVFYYFIYKNEYLTPEYSYLN